jgi:glycosyltransferase involved in cell wall biosynthesis
MRLLTYLPQLAAIGGAELHVLQLTRELARRGLRVDLRYTTDGELHGEFASFCQSVIETPSIRYGGSPVDDLRRIAPASWSAVRARPDVLYVNNFTELGWAAAVKTIARVPIVCYLHEFAPFRSASVSVLGKQVGRFLVASEFMRTTWTRHGLDPARVETIPNGIDMSDYPKGTEEDRVRNRRALGLPPDAYVVLYLGRIDTEKGVEVLLDAWRGLDATSAEARLLLVGSPVRNADPAAYLLQLKERAPAGCKWLPMRHDVLEVMHAADVLVLPSVWEEPFGRVLIETMATGRPVVASDCGGIPEILDGPFSEFLFPRGDAAALASRLSALRRWRDERPELADQCIRHVAERYTLQQTANRTEAVLRAVAGKTAPKSNP